MQFNLNAKRPWRFISKLMLLGWRLDGGTEINQGFFSLTKFDTEGAVRSLVVFDNSQGRPVVQIIPPAIAGVQT